MVKRKSRPEYQGLFAKVGGEYFYDRVDSPFSGDPPREKISWKITPNPWRFESNRAHHRGWFQFKLEWRLDVDPL